MGKARLLLFCFGLLFLSCLSGFAEKEKATIVVPLEPEGEPKDLFIDKVGGLSCLRGYRGVGRLFWISSDRVAVLFSTAKPCSKDANTSATNTLRLIVYDTSGKKIASKDWNPTEHFGVLRGPEGTLVVHLGAKVQFLDGDLHEIESGQFDAAPVGIFSSPFGRTMPVLSDGKTLEFYTIHPLTRVSTLTLSDQASGGEYRIEAAGDERAAAVACPGRTALSCNRIQVLTPDENFSLKDGQPWAYDEADKKVYLNPVGFLSDHELLVHRESFFTESVELVRKNGTATPFQINGLVRPTTLVGITRDGKRFALQAGGDPELSNQQFKRFVVAEIDSPKAIFEKKGSVLGSASGMSPDGKWFAIMDKAELSLYSLP